MPLMCRVHSTRDQDLMMRNPVIETKPCAPCVRVLAPGRLHLGFMDLNGGLGRRFGSLGLALDGVSTRVSGRRAVSIQAEGCGAERARDCAQRLFRALGLDGGVQLCVEASVPRHAGLGSGTQLALAVGSVIDRLYGLGLGTRRLGSILERGARSGIGLGAFDTGGFLVDGGRGTGEQGLPPLTVRLPFPARWRVLLIYDSRLQGLHGGAEREAFGVLPLFPAHESAHLCRVVLMQILPALSTEDLDQFGRGVGLLQRVVGDHFAGAQGGRYASPGVAQVLSWLEGEGLYGVGQSSWGPTGFAVVGSEARARALLGEARQRFADHRDLSFQVVRGRNCGHEYTGDGGAGQGAVVSDIRARR